MSREDPRLRLATLAVMRHYGYTEEQIEAAEKQTCKQSGCEFIDGYDLSDCTDEEGRSLHPVRDELWATSEIVRVAFEAVSL